MQRHALCGSLFCAMAACLPSQADEPPTLPVAEATTLGKTIRLEFTLSAEGFSESFTVVCASKKYAIHAGQTDGGDDYSFDIGGTVTERSAGKYLVTFKASLDRADAESGFDLAATGSAIIELGKPKKLGSLHSYTLLLTAIDEEAKDIPENK